jgi:hypothetical protein
MLVEPRAYILQHFLKHQLFKGHLLMKKNCEKKKKKKKLYSKGMYFTVSSLGFVSKEECIG